MDDPTGCTTFAAYLDQHSAAVVLPAAELTRLRKIEAAARDVACVAANNPARRYKLNALRKALEAKTDGN
jgi:hypothetical protein